MSDLMNNNNDLLVSDEGHFSDPTALLSERKGGANEQRHFASFALLFLSGTGAANDTEHLPDTAALFLDRKGAAANVIPREPALPAPAKNDPTPEGPSIWWLETNAMVSSMNIDNAINVSYMGEMDAQSKITADMATQLTVLDKKIQDQANSNSSPSPWKMFVAIACIVVVCAVVFATGGAAAPAAVAAADGAAAGAGAAAAGGGIASWTAIQGGAAIAALAGTGTVMGVAYNNKPAGLTEKGVSADQSIEDNTEQQLYGMIGNNAAQKTNLAMQLGPSAQSQKNETWANIIDSVIQAENQTNTIRI